MATATVTTPTVPSALSISTEMLTLYRVAYVKGTNDKGEPVQAFDVVNEKTGEEIEKESSYDGHEVVSLEKQSFVQYGAKDDEGWKQLVPDEAERAFLTYGGAKGKQRNRAYQWLKQTDKDGNFVNAVNPDAPIDQAEDLKEASNRRLTPAEKAFQEVASIGLTPQMIAEFEKLLAQRKSEMGLST